MNGLWTLLTGNIPALVLLLLGVGLLVFEMYIPGFGLPGVLGLTALVLGTVLLGPTFEQAVLLLIVLAAVLCAALVIALITASKGRLSKSRFALNDVAIDPDAAEHNDLNRFVGMVGVAQTPLRPAGVGMFEDNKLSVVSDGEFIPGDAKICVIRVEGNRVVVKKL